MKTDLKHFTNLEPANNQKLHVRKAFTLAETLITLAIIGIVAAMTLPTLIQNYKEKAMHSKLWHAYSLFSQAYLRAVTENGEVEYWDIGDGSDAAGDKKLYDYLKQYLLEGEDCGEEYGCFYDGDYKTMSGGVYGYSPRNHTRYARGVLNNGTSFAVASTGTGCTDTATVQGRCGILYVDLNGYSNPNQAGVDYFAFHITKKGIKPVGMPGYDGGTNGYFCEYNGTSKGNGIGCTAYFLQKGHMNYLKYDISDEWEFGTTDDE